jgi:ABC-type sugar transport system permease subunit
MIFFLPVIIASGIVITVMQSSGMDASLSTSMGTSAGSSTDPSTDTSGSVYVFQVNHMAVLLYQSGLSDRIVFYLLNVISQIFDIAWQSGVQILLFLAGLQSIPKSFYEASYLEGATGWEVFWKITFPLISPITLVCIVYTIIDSFSSPKNPVIGQIFSEFALLNITYSATLSWIYFVIISIVLAIVVRLIARKVVYMED